MEESPGESQSTSILEGLKNTHQDLARMTAAAPLSPETKTETYPFSYALLDDKNTVDITIHGPNGDIKLGDFLPDKVSIYHIEGTRAPVASKRWTLDNKLTAIRVSADVAWIQANPTQGIPILAHELGHALSTEDRPMPESPELPEVPKKPQDVEQTIDISCAFVADGLEEEVRSWNSGKIVADLFGLDGTRYESQMENQMRSYQETYYLQLQQSLEQYIKAYENTGQGEFKTQKTFKVYDVSQQEKIEVTFEELKAILAQTSKEKADRAAEPEKALGN
jgi:hypothetical protein